MTINVAKVDAAQTAKTQLGLAAATNLSGEDTQPSVFSKEIATTKDPSLNPGTLKFEEDIAGGMGRHLGVFSCTMIIVGRIIGTGIFSTPSSIISSVGSVGASLMLWALGFLLSFCGLFVWLEYGTMFPRSGGEKVYLEAVYTKPKYLATFLFATNAILLGFTSANCIIFANNILITAGQIDGLCAEFHWVVEFLSFFCDSLDYISHHKLSVSSPSFMG